VCGYTRVGSECGVWGDSLRVDKEELVRFCEEISSTDDEVGDSFCQLTISASSFGTDGILRFCSGEFSTLDPES